MAARGNVITVGIRPAWDVVCDIDGLEWGDHKVIDEQIAMPAGKALNVSKALAWMCYPSIATGLWGQEDYNDMVDMLRPMSCFIDVRFSAVRGRTRRNITINDTLNKRQMHLRLTGSLANKGSLKRLQTQLEGLVSKNDIMVFAGAMPEGQLMADVVEMMQMCIEKGARIIVDTHSESLKKIITSRSANLISPNLEELELQLGNRVKDDPSNIIKESRKLLDDIEMVLVSRGDMGAVLVTRGKCYSGHCVNSQDREVFKTVACGDYLLAGFIAGLVETEDYKVALERGLKVASVFAWGLSDINEWWEVQDEAQIEITEY